MYILTNHFSKKKFSRIGKFIITLTLASAFVYPTFASAVEVSIVSKDYVLDKKEKFEIDGVKPKETELTGKLVLSGNLDEESESTTGETYIANDGKITFNYTSSSAISSEKTNDGWYYVSDSSKSINGAKLDNKINKGIILIERSEDGKTYNKISEKQLSEVSDDLYSIDSEKLQKGYYYRVTVAYRVKQKVDESKKAKLITTADYEEKKVAELYEFYLRPQVVLSTKEGEKSSSFNSKILSPKANKGYTGSKEITPQNPHYGWDLGEFKLTGFTDTRKEDGTTVVLKNVGDEVKLWFTLKQNIDKLNDKDNLSIARDQKGYYQTFQTPKTDLGRGAIYIRKTDEHDKIHEPILYSDYLATTAKTEADTTVELFEEGDYEVVMLYKVKNTPRKVVGIEVVPEFYDYRIAFDFKVRNSNSMVYPMELETGKELSNKAKTSQGFKLDWAKNKYLKVQVKYEIKTKNGLDTRYNRSAKSEDEYTEQGTYTFTATNDYTGEKTTKTIIVE